ncbi:ATP-binding cassette domain-containing protein [bacterium]|nr:ATP-binding cassette domain-containing protein [bacterium]
MSDSTKLVELARYAMELGTMSAAHENAREVLSQSAKDAGTIVDIINFHKAYEGRPVLAGVNLQVQRGEHLSILGPGGCGKSTLLKGMIGLIPPDMGQVSLFGRNLASLGREERNRLLQRVGMAFQLGALFDFMTVRENILFAMENMTCMSAYDMEERVHRMLASVNLPAAARKLPSELSGGMRRRVGIVRALATSPDLALLDEPTAGLDPVTSAVVIDMIHKLAASIGSSLVCVTSNVEVAFTFARRVAILHDGRIVAKGTWEELHKLGDPWITHFLDVRGYKPAESHEQKEIING